MAKVKMAEIDSKEKYRIIGELYGLVSDLKTKKEIIDFFVGLFSTSEALMMARRVQIAKLIVKGASYEDIRAELKVGFDTIRKTDLWLNGEDENYNLWIKKHIINIDKNKTKKSGAGEYSSSPLDKYVHHRTFKKLIS